MKINRYTVVITLASVAILIAYIILQERTKLLETEKYSSISKAMQTEIKTLIDEKKNATLALGISLTFNKHLTDALQTHNTKSIKLDELSLVLKENSDFKNVWFQVITKDGKSLYRSWIDKTGDSLVKFRPDVVELLKSPKIMSTISVGKFDMTFKSMVPIYAENQFIGIIEVITHFNSISKKLLKKNIEPLILVDEKYKKQLIYPFTKLFIDDYYVANLDAKDKYMNIVRSYNPKNLIDSNQEYYRLDKHNNIMTIYKLPDINGTKMGHIMLFKNFNDIDMSDINLMREKMIFYIFSFIVLLILFSYYFATKKFISEISLKNEEMKRLNKSLSIALKEQQLIQQQKNQQQEVLFQQSKMAAMGEMIGNIAHQWRQPISVISMWANNIIVDIDMQDINTDKLKKYAYKINEQTIHLSQTIDDFRNFFVPDKSTVTFNLKSSITKTLNLLSASFKVHEIEIIKNIDNDIKINALENELTQAILNIIKNAKDIISTLDFNSKKLIFINIYQKEENAIIEILDNGGGINEDIIHKIFEPYFTTKHKSQGTGIGLYMTESIITKHLHGKISVHNIDFSHDNIEYKGALFKIEIPLNEKI